MNLHRGPLALLSLRSSVTSGQIKSLGYRHIPRIIASEIASQFPYTLSEGRERVQLNIKSEKFSMGASRLS